MTIINPLPYNIADGQAIDAVPVMADLNQIVSNVNANAVANASLSASGGAALVGYQEGATGSVVRTVASKLQEFPSLADFGGTYTNPGVTNGWLWDSSHSLADGAVASFQLTNTIPSTVSMAGNGNVQGAAFLITGTTSAQTPSGSISEQNLMRMRLTTAAQAGNNLQTYLINGGITLEHDVTGSVVAGGSENACMLLASTASGPTSGTAAGIWVLDLHNAKPSGVVDGKMVTIEVGVHKVPALGSAKNYGVHIWSGDWDTIAGTTRAGDALHIDGASGFTNYINVIYTDGLTEMFNVNQYGQVLMQAPVGNQTLTVQSNQSSTSASFFLYGQNASGAHVNFFVQTGATGGVTLGTSSADNITFEVNGTAIFSLIQPANQGLLQTTSMLEATGTASAALGGNFPGANPGSPYRWVRLLTSDSTKVYFPVWS